MWSFCIGDLKVEVNKDRRIMTKREPGAQRVTGPGLSFFTWQLWLGATDAQPNTSVCITKTHTHTRVQANT